MSDPPHNGKPPTPGEKQERAPFDPARGWAAALDLLAQDEIERLERLSEEEATAAAKARGVRIPTAEEMLSRAAQRAAERSKDQAGHSDRAPTSDERPSVPPLARSVEAADAGPTSLRRRGRRAALGWGLAMAAGVALAAAVLAARMNAPKLADTEDAGATPVSARERAEVLRTQAVAACRDLVFDTCEAKLDEARALDPQGESEARVAAARRAIDESRAPPPQPTGPEKPLLPGAPRK